MEIIENLKELARSVHKCATAQYTKVDTRQKWAKIENQIYKTLNSILESYEEQEIKEKVEELAERVEDLMEEDTESREED